MSLSAKEMAIELGTDARTARKFFRDNFDKDTHPGQGKRWTFEKKQVKSLKKKFDAWQEEHAAPKPKDEDLEDEDVEEIEDDDLEEIEDEDDVEEI